MVKVAIVSTSSSQWKGGVSGVWLEEMAAPYYVFKEAGFETQLVSVKGGEPPVDPGSRWEEGGFYTPEAKRFDEDAEAQAAFKSMPAVSTLNAADLDAIFLAGGHGPLIDFNDPALVKLVEEVYAQGKVVASVCHGGVGLAYCKKPDGTPLLQGLGATVFSDAEESSEVMPEGNAQNVKDELGWLCESKFRELGAKYSKADEAWMPHVVTCGNLITGQQMSSSEPAAQAIVKALK
jgi:putative intracellular protease/amidase